MNRPKVVGKAFEAIRLADLWRVRYETLFTRYSLLEATLHEVRNHHSCSIDRHDFTCIDCGWKGSTDPYAND